MRICFQIWLSLQAELVGKFYQANKRKDAIKLISQNVFDVIVTDLRMGALEDDSGLQILKMAKKISELTQVIVVTSYGIKENQCKSNTFRSL